MSSSNLIETRQIPVVVDKSHLITIGERLYTEKMSFVRELVNNAYDADATEVYVNVTSESAVIHDNGSGMDEQGLRQYFTIGSSFKKEASVSPKFQRKRIGEFGIGKFAALAACRQFEVETQNGDFHARLLFDKETWSQHEDWHLKIDILEPDPLKGDGTTVSLRALDTQILPGRARRYLTERTPIYAPNFSVFLNAERISGEIIAGKQIPINIPTPHGPITGHLTIASPAYKPSQFGIAVLVKGIMIRYESFRLEHSHKAGAMRITGRINADFLPITSNRDDFIRDTSEFTIFYQLIKKEIDKALGIVKRQSDFKANLQASRVLKDALSKIGKALKHHTNLFPQTQVPVSNASDKNDVSQKNQEGYKVSDAKFMSSDKQAQDLFKEANEPSPIKKRRRTSSSKVLGDKSVMRNLRVASFDVAVRLEHLGIDEEESLISGGVIFVNLDHSLYHTYQEKDELLTLHVTRVVTKELVLHTGIKDVEEAFALQSALLADALKERRS